MQTKNLFKRLSEQGQLIIILPGDHLSLLNDSQFTFHIVHSNFTDLYTIVVNKSAISQVLEEQLWVLFPKLHSTQVQLGNNGTIIGNNTQTALQLPG